MIRTSIPLLHPQPLLLYILDQLLELAARQSNYQVLSFLVNDSNVHENMMLPKLDTFVLLTNEGSSLCKKDEHWSNIKHGDDGMRKGNKNEVSNDAFRTLKPP